MTLIDNYTIFSNCIIDEQYKRVHDHIHGYIYISNVAQRIIDTPVFQRLRSLKQLGACCYVFPNAIHTRFEHSIGTYHLAGKVLKRILTKTDPNDIDTYLRSIKDLSNYYDRRYNKSKYVLDDYVCELIKIAALCHDLGHGPFSHVFDDFFIPSVRKKLTFADSHENRSGILLDKIVSEDPFLKSLIHPCELQFIKSLIHPSSDNKGFVYQIVSNNMNGLDVDKYDYIVRDAYVLGEKIGFDCSQLTDYIVIIDTNICYPGELPYEAYRLFHTRYEMHKKIYSHKSVIAFQLMIVDLFNLLDPILKISDSVNDPDRFCKMTDTYILDSISHITAGYFAIDMKYCNNIIEATKIHTLLNKHIKYAFIGKIISDTKTAFDSETFVKTNGLNEKYINNVIIYRSKIGYVSGNKKSPLDNLYTCSTKSCPDGNKIKKVDIKNYSHLIPKKHQEHITMIFYKDVSDSSAIKDLTGVFEKTEAVFA